MVGGCAFRFHPDWSETGTPPTFFRNMGGMRVSLPFSFFIVLSETASKYVLKIFACVGLEGCAFRICERFLRLEKGAASQRKPGSDGNNYGLQQVTLRDWAIESFEISCSYIYTVIMISMSSPQARFLEILQTCIQFFYVILHRRKRTLLMFWVKISRAKHWFWFRRSTAGCLGFWNPYRNSL